MTSIQLLARTALQGRSLVAKTLAARSVSVSRCEYHSNAPLQFHATPSPWMEDIDAEAGVETKSLKYTLPQRIRQKLISASDAVGLVRSGDTIAVAGFVTQGSPELLLKALGDRFAETGQPSDLTLLFGGGPGDYGERGLSHLAKKKDGVQMLRRTIGGHYGQVPKVAAQALNEEVEAWCLPMGSISRMIRAQSTHSPGHITNVGLGTFVDPEISGGAINEKAKASKLHSKLVTRMQVLGETNLCYKALPINVALIRGTTADSMGNITVEQESLLCDQKITAAAAKNSGGIVIAQVKRVAANGSIPSRQVAVPAPLVDMVVVVDEDEHDLHHSMSYISKHIPALTGEIVSPAGSVEPMPMDIRKLIARRAFFGLKPNKVVNLGIGLPEGVAGVAAEEGMLDYVTLSTEPGVFGGLPASGHNFGPAYNASSLMEMNQMFDFYDGGGLDMCFLGAAQISPQGDVNVSRMSKDRLTGPGGFIDISQSTQKICFMLSMTAKGLKISTPGDGTLKIDNEGKVKKFVPTVYEKTFSGDEAVRRGQEVIYVTERAVFTRTSAHSTIELIEIAPGLDLQKDVLDQMEFKPVVSPNLKTMDPRIFNPGKMKVTAEIFGSLDERFNYHESDHTMYLDMFGITLNSEEDVDWFINSVREMLVGPVSKKGPINMVVNYEGFDLGKGLETHYAKVVDKLQKEMYKSAKRYTGYAFQRAQLKTQLHMSDLDPNELFDKWDEDGNGTLSFEELREGFARDYQLQLTQQQLNEFKNEDGDILCDRIMFAKGVAEILQRD